MNDLCARLDVSEERYVATQVIKEMTESANSTSSCLKYIRAYLQNLTKLRKFMTAMEVEEALCSLLVADEPLVYVQAVALCFEHTSRADEFVSKLFSLVCENFDRILESTLSINGTTGTQLDFTNSLCMIVSMKDRLANYFGANDRCKDYTTLYQSFDVSIQCAVTRSLERAFQMVDSGVDVNLNGLSIFIGRGRNISVEDGTLLSFTVRWLGSRDQSPIWDRLSQRIFLDDTHGKKETASIVSAVLSSALNHDQLIRCLGYSITSSLLVKLQCKARITTHMSPNHVIDAVVNYIVVAGGPELYNSFFQDILFEWSDKNTVKQMPDTQQKHLTKSVLYMAYHGQKCHFIQQLRDVIFPILVNGVQERLSNNDMTIRQSGMFVGETISKMMTDVDPLTFEYDKDEWLEEMQMISQGDISKPSCSFHRREIRNVENVPRVTIEKLKSLELDSDDEMDFPSYTIPDGERNLVSTGNDDEPEKNYPRPAYIRDYFERLDEKEKYEVFESAFLNLSPFIRRGVVGFDDVASAMINKLIFLTDKFKTKDFENTRQSCIISCLVVKPSLAPEVIQMLFTRSCSMFHRYVILETVQKAAKELSCPPETAETTIHRNVVEVCETNKANNWEEVVAQRIKANTRYFGAQQRDKATDYNSRFTAVAPLFFYPLLTTSTGEHLSLRDQDAPLLSRVLFTAGIVLTFAPFSPSIVNMSSTLIALVSPLRYHDDKSVRAAAMFCFNAVLTSVSDSIFSEKFAELAQNWVDWCVSIIDNVQESEKDQQMAKLLISSMISKLNATNSNV